MALMTIGKLSGATAVKVTTIRYYESIGLLDEPQRSASGQRLYAGDSVERLRFIRHARDLGFPVSAVRELISLQVEPGRECVLVDQIARSDPALCSLPLASTRIACTNSMMAPRCLQGFRQKALDPPVTGGVKKRVSLFTRSQ